MSSTGLPQAKEPGGVSSNALLIKRLGTQPRSADDLDVELSAAELSEHPHPQRKVHLEAARCGEVAQVEHVVQPRSAASEAAVCRAMTSLPATKIVESSASRAGCP